VAATGPWGASQPFIWLNSPLVVWKFHFGEGVLPDMIAALEAWATSSLGLFIQAAIAVLLVGSAAARFDRRRRERREARARERRVAIDPIAELPVPSRPTVLLNQARKPEWFQACEEDRKKEDDEAKRYQRRYRSCVASSVGALGFGVVIMCLSIVIYRETEWLKKFATHFDLLATFYALGCFVVARVANRAFVITRSFVETLRAWINLALIFPLEGSGDVFAAYKAKKAEIEKRYWARRNAAASQDARGGTTDRPDKREVPIYTRVERCWTEIHGECLAAGLRRTSSSADLGFYLKARPLGQLEFFITAQGRLYQGQRSREGLMTVLYVVSVVLAILKALSVFKGDFMASLPVLLMAPVDYATAMHVDWISTALLVVMVLSAAATNAYISRNERSLLHSYHAQERRIRAWFETFAATSGGAAGPHTVDTVIAFEEIMLNDLLDFIHITSRDVIEVPR
jgi:hypothetical protein